MVSQNVSSVSFDSEPGVYELLALNGKAYEVILPGGSAEYGTLLLSEQGAEPDDLEDRETLVLLDVEASVGEAAIFTIDRGLQGLREARTVEIVAIVKVG